jgi:hypothetical protein
VHNVCVGGETQRSQQRSRAVEGIGAGEQGGGGAYGEHGHTMWAQPSNLVTEKLRELS